MATIRKRTTSKGAISFQVVWREPVRDDFGAPTGKDKQTSETFDTERKAKRRLREVETALDSAHGLDPSSAKAKANRPVGHYARQYLDSLAGLVDPTTVEGYESIYRTHLALVFGSRPVGGVTVADVMAFRARLVSAHRTRPLSFQPLRHLAGATARFRPSPHRPQADADKRPQRQYPNRSFVDAVLTRRARTVGQQPPKALLMQVSTVPPVGLEPTLDGF